jgi:hypothetical protein
MLHGLRCLSAVFTFVGVAGAAVPLGSSDVASPVVASFEDGSTAQSCTPAEQCCKICSKGKACGNSCIRASYTCHKGRGCACNAEEVCE